MDRSKIITLFNTVKSLKRKQIYYRLYYIFRNNFFKKTYNKTLKTIITPLKWSNYIVNNTSFHANNNFSFLNQNEDFKDQIDWSFSKFGKLWTYNLNYFDFLNQENISEEEGLRLIEDYIEKESSLFVGKEPYPISLKNINWVKFLSKNKIQNQKINQVLFNHYQLLMDNLEYHLLGNHLLENSFSLLFGSLYFKDIKLYRKAVQILKKELDEQVLNDGAHFELSTMYHQIICTRLLDCIKLLSSKKSNAKSLQG